MVETCFVWLAFTKTQKADHPFIHFCFYTIATSCPASVLGMLYTCMYILRACLNVLVIMGPKKKTMPFSSRQWIKMLLSFHQNWVWSSSYSNLKSIEPFVDIVVTVSKRFVQQKWEGIGRGEGYFLAKFSLLVCPPVPQILTLFQTKICP